MAACNSIAYGPAGQVAAVAAPTLEALRQQYLAGASEQELLALVVRRGSGKVPALGSDGLAAGMSRVGRHWLLVLSILADH